MALTSNQHLPDLLNVLRSKVAEQHKWIMMVANNISSAFEYGRPATATMCVMAKKAVAGAPGSTHLGGMEEERVDIDDEHKGNAGIKSSEDALPKQPPAFKFALQLTFSHVLRQPACKSFQYTHSNFLPHCSPHIPFHCFEALPHSQRP